MPSVERPVIYGLVRPAFVETQIASAARVDRIRVETALRKLPKESLVGVEFSPKDLEGLRKLVYDFRMHGKAFSEYALKEAEVDPMRFAAGRAIELGHRVVSLDSHEAILEHRALRQKSMERFKAALKFRFWPFGKRAGSTEVEDDYRYSRRRSIEMGRNIIGQKPAAVFMAEENARDLVPALSQAFEFDLGAHKVWREDVFKKIPGLKPLKQHFDVQTAKELLGIR